MLLFFVAVKRANGWTQYLLWHDIIKEMMIKSQGIEGIIILYHNSVKLTYYNMISMVSVTLLQVWLLPCPPISRRQCESKTGGPGTWCFPAVGLVVSPGRRTLNLLVSVAPIVPSTVAVSCPSPLQNRLTSNRGKTGCHTDLNSLQLTIWLEE